MKEETRKKLEEILEYWIDWFIKAGFKLALFAVFIVFGPVTGIAQLAGFHWFAGGGNFIGVIFCCVLLLVFLPDLIWTLIVPWKGGGENFPFGLEDDWPTWKEYKELGA